MHQAWNISIGRDSIVKMEERQETGQTRKTTIMLSQDQLTFFQEKGYLILRDIMSRDEVADLQKWSQEVHDLPRARDATYMPYEEVQKDGKRVLCRTENFANVHKGFDGLLRGQYLINILSQVAQEPMVLFKEKINYKLAGSGGFDPHIDATAYTHIKDVKHLTILLAVDATNMSNGGLEVVEGSHAMNVPINPQDNCIEPTWVKSQTWIPVELTPGELLIFGSYLAHRSGTNESHKDRKAIYATYNCTSEGDLHDKYYEDRAVVWPATHMRAEGEKYETGRLRYGFGSPMLTVG